MGDFPQLSLETTLSNAACLDEFREDHAPVGSVRVVWQFPKLTSRRLRRGSFHSLVALQEAINRFVEEHNCGPRPLMWTADPDAIVEKVRRGYHALASMARPAG
jgi:hypothetical protein